MTEKLCLEFLAEAGARWDQYNVRWKCIPGTWSSAGKGFVSWSVYSAWCMHLKRFITLSYILVTSLLYIVCCCYRTTKGKTQIGE